MRSDGSLFLATCLLIAVWQTTLLAEESASRDLPPGGAAGSGVAEVEVVDVSTPLTVERYTGNWRGTQAWPAKGNFVATVFRGLTRTLLGLENFYMAGQWGEGMGGLSTVAISGRNTIRRLCRQDGKQFVARSENSQSPC